MAQNIFLDIIWQIQRYELALIAIILTGVTDSPQTFKIPTLCFNSTFVLQISENSKNLFWTLFMYLITYTKTWRKAVIILALNTKSPHNLSKSTKVFAVWITVELSFILSSHSCQNVMEGDSISVIGTYEKVVPISLS